METSDNQDFPILKGDAFDLAEQMLREQPTAPIFADFGSYRMLRELGRGGMGVVWLARDEALDRLVALKFLRPAADPEERFTREIRTLAQLEHPYIARLYDPGHHPNGTPFFAMEYVEGQAIDEYCRDRKCSVEERLRLFRSVCEAVQYAHRRPVIHLDLKPSNILVTEEGVPKLLDFGIAKQLVDASQPAHQTEMRLTTAYAAPEQFRREPVGVYSDVYALGVTLYELLAGRHPYDLADRTPGEAEGIIAGGAEPSPPSAATAENGGRIAGASQSQWRDLDVLCLKAMKRDIQRRYPSVEALIQDIDHYLRDEPLSARPDSRRYRLHKFVRRNQKAVLAATLGIAFVIGLVAFFTVRLTNARDAALAETARTRRVEQFIENLFQGGDAEAGPANDLRAVTLLDRGVKEAEGLNGDPELQGDFFQTLGTVYQALGKLDRADALLHQAYRKRQESLAADPEEVGDTLVKLGLLRMDQGQLPDAERIIRKALAMDQHHPGVNRPAVSNATAALGHVLVERGWYAQGIPLLEEAARQLRVQRARDDDLSTALSWLADGHFYTGDYARADSLQHEAMNLDIRIHTDRHPSVAGDLIDLGNVQTKLGNYTGAEKFFRQALAIDLAWYGADHPETADAENYVAQSLTYQQRYAQAQALLKQALAAMKHAYGETHPRVALLLTASGNVAYGEGDLKEAEADFSRAADIYRSVYGQNHQMTAIARGNLATVFLRRDQYLRAEQLLREVIGSLGRMGSADPGQLAIFHIKLGRAMLRQRHYREAERETLAGYEVLTKLTSPSVSFLQAARRDLAEIYEVLKQPEKSAHFHQELTANEPKSVVAGVRQ